MQERQLEREREKERNDNRAGFAALGLLVAIILLCLLMANASSIGAIFTGDIAVPASSGDLTGISYSDVEQRFADAGFTNIECIDLNDLDLVSGFFNSDGSVDHVTINGEEDFSSSSHYPSDATIRIYYHSHPDYSVFLICFRSHTGPSSLRHLPEGGVTPRAQVARLVRSVRVRAQ